MIRRIDLVNKETGEVAATLTWDGGAAVDVEVLDPSMRRAVSAAAHKGKILRPETGGEAFLDAIVEEFRRSSYWTAVESIARSGAR